MCSVLNVLINYNIIIESLKYNDNLRYSINHDMYIIFLIR